LPHKKWKMVMKKWGNHIKFIPVLLGTILITKKSIVVLTKPFKNYGL